MRKQNKKTVKKAIDSFFLSVYNITHDKCIN